MKQWGCIFLVVYEHESFTIMAQFYQGESTTTADDNHERDRLNIAAFVKMPFHKGLRIFGRHDLYDKDIDAQDTD
ncbi:MAG: hypothetical protein GY801_38990, partial [bacterium]|nr:hypothetical protein [bacterium]